MYCKSILSIHYRKGKKNSTSNKNYGFKHTHCSNISFFDADDVMYNNRINILHYIINKYPEYDIIMHKYTRTLNKLTNIKSKKLQIEKCFYFNSSYINILYRKYATINNVRQWGCCNFFPQKIPVANGWIKVKRSIFVNEKYNESIIFNTAEYSEYNGRFILKGYKVLILQLILL